MKKLLMVIAIWVFSATVLNAAERKSLRENYHLYSRALQSVPLVTQEKMGAMLGLSGVETLEAHKTYIDKNGDVTVRYRQLHKGIPVIGDDVIVARRGNGSIKRLHGYALYDISRDMGDIVPKISGKTAMQLVKQLSTKQGIDAKLITYENEFSRLAIWRDEHGKARLVFEVSFVQYGGSPSRPYYLIDAKTGKVLKHFDNLQYANAIGPGGNQKTGIYYYGSDFDYLDVSQSGGNCTMINDNVKTINLNHGTSETSAFTFTCPENTYKVINGAYSPLNDAHFFGGVIFNMYQDWLNSSPLTFQLQMRVHYSTGYENAFWNGSSMTFGDGGSRFYPLVSLDIATHEVSHGFTEQNSGLVYIGKSGGLNEAFSDMSGEAAEYYMLGTNDWMVGAQVFKGSGALRYMNNPPLDGASIDHQSEYVVGMDVHYSSGVYNKAFYNLATTAGWNTRKAFEVYARANMLYWSGNTNWDDAGNGVIDAACDLGYDTDTVQASLASVGVASSLIDGAVCGQGQLQNMAWLIPVINLILF